MNDSISEQVQSILDDCSDELNQAYEPANLKYEFESAIRNARKNALETFCRLIESRIAEIDADERLHYEPALVEINAPLALVQVALESRITELKVLLRMLDVEAAQ